MGLLDDAIREHLELKRRHGADVGEIERQEREAFGAGDRRAEGEEAQDIEPTAADEDRPAAVAASSYDDAPADATRVMPAAETPDEMDPPPDVDESATHPHERSAPGHDEDPWLVEEQAGSVQPPGGEDDVLEETPDFLQETPEHDRLWFEQKPPRDFDWDR